MDNNIEKVPNYNKETNTKKRKTFSPILQSESSRISRFSRVDKAEIEAFVGNLSNEDIDIREGMKMLLKLQLDSNDSMNELLKRIDRIQEWLENVDEALVDMDTRLAVLEAKSFKQGDDSICVSEIKEDLIQKLSALEDDYRRNNITISGLEENGSELLEETETKVTQLLNTKMDIHDVAIDFARRVGKRSSGKPRLIICKLSSFKDKQKIRLNSSKLKDSGIFINDDYSPRTRDLRYHLRNYSRQLRLKGVSSIKLSYNKLYADGKTFTYDFQSGKIVEQRGHPLA